MKLLPIVIGKCIGIVILKGFELSFIPKKRRMGLTQYVELVAYSMVLDAIIFGVFL